MSCGVIWLAKPKCVHSVEIITLTTTSIQLASFSKDSQDAL